MRLATSDSPDVLCLQEVPVWALRRLAGWSGMTATGVVAAHPRLRSVAVGRVVTEVHHGLLRSAFTGQANAILTASHLRVAADWWSELMLPGEGERRVCQAVRIDGLGVVANFHVTTEHADAQFRRVVDIVETLAGRSEPLVLCGDANVRPGFGTTYDELRVRGYSEPAPGIDQILVRGLAASKPTVWPEERRRAGGRLLSDHAPVELRVG